MIKKIILIPFLALSLSACNGNGEGFGTLIGGILGGVIGSEISDGNTGGVLLGAAIGAAIGNSIGNELDENDRTRQQYAFQQAMEHNQTGSTIEWYNPDSGNSGAYVPQPAYQEVNGGYCREFNQEVQIAGETQEMYGTACRQPDGTWKINPDTNRNSTSDNNVEPNYKKF
jgi:surface antigen